MKYKEFRKRINESLGILESFVFEDKDSKYEIAITSDMRCSIDGKVGMIQFDSIYEAKEYVINQIRASKLIEEVVIMPESKVAELIATYTDVERVTDSHIKNYIEVFNSKEFTLDPVIIEMKRATNDINGKFEFILDDGSRVAISEETLEKLCNKYEMAEFMCESKEDLMQIIKNEE